MNALIYVPKPNIVIPVIDNILAVLERFDGRGKSEGKQFLTAHNLITNDGDLWYAEKWNGDAPTEAFTSLYFSATAVAPAKTSNFSILTGPVGEKAATATYPKRNDGDGDNTGSGVDIATWLHEYTTGDGPFTAIIAGGISRASATGTNPIVTAFSIGSFSKDGSTTLKFFVNHEFKGGTVT